MREDMRLMIVGSFIFVENISMRVLIFVENLG